MDITIVGGGFSGLSLAFYLSKEKHHVTLIEKDDQLGGLTSSFKYRGHFIDQFYHCILSCDSHLLQLISDTGLLNSLFWVNTEMGFWIEGKVYPLNTAADLLKFSPLSLPDRIKSGLATLRLKSIKNWKVLEQTTAEEFLTKNYGKKIYSCLWEPLLASKFGEKHSIVPASWIWGRFQRQSATKEKSWGADKTGYLNGGLKTLIDSLEGTLLKNNVKILKKSEVTKITKVKNNKIITQLSCGNSIESDLSVAAIPQPEFVKILHNKGYEPNEKNQPVPYQGIVCLLLVLNRKLTDYYWIPVVKKNIPFAGIVETTNLISYLPQQDINLVYLMSYTSRKELLEASEERIYSEWVSHLKEIFPKFDTSSITDHFLFRNTYVEPVWTLFFSEKKPSDRYLDGRVQLLSPVRLYPEINCINNCIKQSKELAKKINENVF